MTKGWGREATPRRSMVLWIQQCAAGSLIALAMMELAAEMAGRDGSRGGLRVPFECNVLASLSAAVPHLSVSGPCDCLQFCIMAEEAENPVRLYVKGVVLGFKRCVPNSSPPPATICAPHRPSPCMPRIPHRLATNLSIRMQGTAKSVLPHRPHQNPECGGQGFHGLLPREEDRLHLQGVGA